MLVIIGWIVALLLIGVGGVWIYINQINRELLEGEVRLMKQNPKFEEEPDHMGDFRITRSEWELEDNKRNRPRALALLILGMLIVLVLGICNAVQKGNI